MNNNKGPFRRIRFPFFIGIIPIALLLAALVQWLWNSILPDLVQVGQLSYWKALGLLVLCRILFGGFRGGPAAGRGPFRHNRLREKWMHMSEEERQHFKDQLRQRCSKNEP